MMNHKWKVTLGVLGIAVLASGAFMAGKAAAFGAPFGARMSHYHSGGFGGGFGGGDVDGGLMMLAQSGPSGPAAGPGAGPGAERGPGPMGWRGGHHGHGFRGGMQGGPGRFGMMRTDKNLTPDEVRKIAEGFLLWRGERQLRVGAVEPGEGDWINLSVVTADNGGFVLRLAMDKNTGRIRRIQ